MKPFKKERIADPARQPAAMSGAPGAKARKAVMVPTLAARREPFTRCRLFIARGLLDMRPASFINATMEPVKVTPPRRVRFYKKNQIRKEKLTNKNTQISCNHMQRTDISNMRHDAADASQNRGQSNYRV